MANYTMWRLCAAVHRDLAEFAICDEAKQHHRMWAAKYEQMLHDQIDYFAITREVSA